MQLAQLMLGSLYYLGEGVPEDYVLAHMWFNLAASGLSGEDRKTAAEGRAGVAKNMTPEDISEAQRLAREWKPKK